MLECLVKRRASLGSRAVTNYKREFQCTAAPLNPSLGVLGPIVKIIGDANAAENPRLITSTECRHSGDNKALACVSALLSSLNDHITPFLQYPILSYRIAKPSLAQPGLA